MIAALIHADLLGSGDVLVWFMRKDQSMKERCHRRHGTRQLGSEASVKVYWKSGVLNSRVALAFTTCVSGIALQVFCHRFRATPDMKFFVDSPEMGTHRVIADVQL